jgi:hypothetical protein
VNSSSNTFLVAYRDQQHAYHLGVMTAASFDHRFNVNLDINILDDEHYLSTECEHRQHIDNTSTSHRHHIDITTDNEVNDRRLNNEAERSICHLIMGVVAEIEVVMRP